MVYDTHMNYIYTYINRYTLTYAAYLMVRPHALQYTPTASVAYIYYTSMGGL